MGKITRQISTPLGDVRFMATADDCVDLDTFTEIGLSYPQSYLPPGMSVDQLAACFLITQPPRQISNLVFECMLPNAPTPGGAESGENLDAQSWSSSLYTVYIGTEDYDAMRARLPGLFVGANLNVIDYLPYGFRIRLSVIEENQRVSLHYVVASNRLPEPRDCSCWYAVDIDHELVLKSRIGQDSGK